MLFELAKAAVAVAITPVALVADIMTLPESAESGRDPFSRTAGLLNAAGKNVSYAVKPGGKGGAK